MNAVSFVPLLVLSLFTALRWLITFLAVRVHVAYRSRMYFMSFAVGALLGNAFIHVLPHAFFFNPNPRFISTMMLLGVLFMFCIEKCMRVYTFFVHREVHDQDILAINHFIIGTIHATLVGITLAASFLQSFGLGITTTIALGLITSAQVISSFTIVIQHGLSKSRALWLTNLATLGLLIGGVAVYHFHFSISKIDHVFLPLGAGAFIYNALRKLIPELQEEPRLWLSLVQIGMILLGISLMFILPA